MPKRRSVVDKFVAITKGTDRQHNEMRKALLAIVQLPPGTPIEEAVILAAKGLRLVIKDSGVV